MATYSQAVQNYGTSLLWLLLLLIPVLIVNQEMVVRLGAVTGMGHGKMIPTDDAGVHHQPSALGAPAASPAIPDVAGKQGQQLVAGAADGVGGVPDE